MHPPKSLLPRRVASLGFAMAVVALAGDATATSLPTRDLSTAEWLTRSFGSHKGSGPDFTTGDLLQLRDLDSISISPDGQRVAFAVRQGRPDENDYLLRWFVAPTSGEAPPIDLGLEGGQPVRLRLYGFPLPERAKWSPDGSRLALRRRTGDRIALVMIDLLTRRATEVFDGESQVVSFEWSRDGALIFKTGFNAARLEKSSEQEARHGWLLNERMSLWSARTPSPEVPDCGDRPAGVDPGVGDPSASSPSCDVRILAYDPLGSVRPASTMEAAELDPAARSAKLANGVVGQVSPPTASGNLAWTETFSPWRSDSWSPMRRIATNLTGASICTALACASQHFLQLGWSRGGSSLWYTTREGHGSGTQTVFEWKPGSAAPRRVFAADGALDGCEASGSTIYCVRQTLTRPGHIVAIDLNTGKERIVVDPNPEFSDKAFPKIDKISLKDADGNSGYAHLVYPRDYQKGRLYPLVLVGYISRGFLRGGLGAEYPIFPLSAQGYFVLSFDYPIDDRRLRDLPKLEFDKPMRRDQHQLRMVVGSLEGAVRSLIDRGLVDRSRVAITGLSFGAELVHNALQDSDVFAVGIASQMRMDIANYAQFPDIPYKAHSMAMYNETSPLARPGGEVIKLSWSQQPERLRAPLLINAHQYEALNGFEGLAMLKASKRPIEVRIFPDEQHVVYHPQNLAGIYENNLMWLNFWLKGEEDPRPEFKDQYHRWRAMSERLAAERASVRTAGGTR